MKRFRPLRPSRQLILRLTGLLASLGLLGSMVDFSRFAELLASLSWGTVFLALILAGVRFWLLMERWRLLLPESAGQRRWDHLLIMLASGSVNLFLPGIVGSDIVRSVMIAGRSGKAPDSNAFLSVYLDRVIGLSSILLLGLVTVGFTPDFAYRGSFILFTLSALLLLWLLVWLSRHPALSDLLDRWLRQRKVLGPLLSDRLFSLLRTLNRYSPGPGRMLAALLLSFPIHGLWFLMVWLIGRDIGADISLALVSLVTIIVWVATLLPLSIAGIGVRELGFVYLLGQYGVDTAQAMMLGLFQSFVLLLFALAGLPILWYRTGRKR